MNILSRRPGYVASALVVVAVLAGLVVLAWNRAGSPAQGAESNTYLLTDDALPPAASSIERAATRATSLDELDKEVSGPGVIVLDSGAAERLSAGSLKQFANRGYALVGVNVPIDRLSQLADFSSEMADINPRFAEVERVPAAFEGDFFTALWRTRAGARTEQWSRVQQISRRACSTL